MFFFGFLLLSGNHNSAITALITSRQVSPPLYLKQQWRSWWFYFGFSFLFFLVFSGDHHDRHCCFRFFFGIPFLSYLLSDAPFVHHYTLISGGQASPLLLPWFLLYFFFIFWLIFWFFSFSIHVQHQLEAITMNAIITLVSYIFSFYFFLFGGDHLWPCL